jgi:two-component system, OmpR family, alkaline phosphatase synthesis response regulator PhoP
MATGTVLVIDDDPAIVDFLEMALEGEGYRVLASVDGEALRLAHDLQPNLILLDIMMPGMDGVEVSRRLRADPVTAGIPIVVMSAQDRLRATAALMPIDDRLPKPFALDRLFSTVDRWTRPL